MSKKNGTGAVVEHHYPGGILAGAALLAGLALCAPAAHAAPRALGIHRSGLTRGPAPSAALAPDCPPCDSLGVLENMPFSRPLVIDNPYLPLKPGNQLVF